MKAIPAVPHFRAATSAGLTATFAQMRELHDRLFGPFLRAMADQPRDREIDVRADLASIFSKQESK